MKKNVSGRIKGILLGIVCCLLCGGCGSTDPDSKVVFTTGWKENEIFRIAEESCYREELLVYLTTTRNQYEKVYGSQIWQTEHNGVTLGENVKETVLSRIAQVKTMYLMAGSRGVTLTEEEEALVQLAAEEYFGRLSESEIAVLGVTQEGIGQMYREYALAQKVYQSIIENVNPEISDDEARIITVQHILLPIVTTDEKGIETALTAAEKASVYQEALKVRALAAGGEQDFEKLATQYSKDDTLTYSFGKGERESAYEEEAFRLETNEISSVVEGEKGYYIIKCISTFNISETDENKVKILEQRRKDVFEAEYDAFVQTVIRRLNEEAFSQIDLLHDNQVTADCFFEIYHQYLQ